MSTQQRSSGGGRNQKKSNSISGGGGDASTHASNKKTDASKTEKTEKAQPKVKPTAEQLRIAQITNSNTSEDPQMSMKVSMLLEMTQRSEEDVCCALNECDYDLDAAVNFLLESLPVGAFEKSSKKKRNKPANTSNEGAGGDGDFGDPNANTDKREKSRNRSSNRGGRAHTDSRGWRGREARENDRNQRDNRGGGERGDDRGDNRGGRDRYGGGVRNGPGSGRNSGYIGRSGRGGGRMGGRNAGGHRGDRGGYGSRNNANDDHQEVELWDNTIAQNAEKQQQPSQDDAWGDWNNEEYEGSLKDSKVFTTSNLQNQTAASVVSGGLGGGGGGGGPDISAPPGLEHHLGTSVLGGGPTLQHQQGSHLNVLVGSAVVAGGTTNAADDTAGVANTTLQSGSAATPLMQYSAAVTNSAPQQLQQQQQSSVAASNLGTVLSATQYNATDTFSNAASAAATLVQQVQQQQHQQQQQQQQAPLKPSATLSAEQSQYFNSLSSQNTAGGVQQASSVSTYAQSAAYGQNSGVQYSTSYANVFASAPGSNVPGSDQTQLVTGNQQPQVRRARAKLPPPSKIPSSAVEMPGDNSMNNIGYLDVQFGGLDFGTDESFDTLPEKFNASVTIESQQKQDSSSDYQSKPVQQSQTSTLSSDSLSAGTYAQRTSTQPQQQQVSVGGSTTVGSGSNALDQLTKNDPYNQTNTANSASYQSSYQTSVANKVASSYQPSAQAYNSTGYGNVQSSVANSYQPQTYGAYQQNSVNSYQQQQQQQTGVNSQNAAASVSSVTTQNIPVGSNGGNQSSATANASAGYLSSGYSTQQSAYQSTQSVYGSASLSNNSGFAGNASSTASQYSGFSTSSKLKDASTASSVSHFDSAANVSSGVNSNSAGGAAAVAGTNSGVVNATTATSNNNSNAVNSASSVGGGVTGAGNNNVISSQSVGSGGTTASGSGNANSSVVAGVSNVNNNTSAVVAQQTAGGTNTASSVLSSLTNKTNNTAGGSNIVGGSGSSGTVGVTGTGSGSVSSGAGAGTTSGNTTTSSGSSATGGGIMPTNIQMVSQYIQTGMPYYQQPVYSIEELQMMQQRVPHVPGYYDINYTPTSLGAGRDNLGSVAYSTMTDGRFTRTDNNSSPVSNVSSTMSQQAGSSGPMLNVPYAYFYGGNVMPGGFQYSTPAIYPQIPTANTPSGGQFPKPSYNANYGSTSYDTLSQASQDYTKGGYSSSINQQNKTQNVSNQPQAAAGSDIASSMYGKGHVALNKVNSYEKQNFHSGTPPPFNMPNTQTAGGTSAQPYGMYLPMPAAGHHNMIQHPIHQDSNSTGQRQQTSSQSKSAGKQGYSPSYWTGQN